MSDYGDDYEEPQERGFDDEYYEDRRSDRSRSRSNSSSSSSSSSSGDSQHSSHHSSQEEDGRYDDQQAYQQQPTNSGSGGAGFGGLGGGAAMEMMTGMMGKLMSGQGGGGNRDGGNGWQEQQYGNQYPQGGYGQQQAYGQQQYPQQQYGRDQYGQQPYGGGGYDQGGYGGGGGYQQQGYGGQGGYGGDSRGDDGYGGQGFPHPGAPPQQYEPSNAGYAPPQAPYGAQQHQFGGYQPTPSDNGQPHPHHFGPQFTDPRTGETAQAFFEYSRCSGRRKALLARTPISSDIGINYIGTSAELSGCINDAHNIQKFITERYGYKLEDIVMLTDDTNDPRTIPNRENIIKGMKWLVDGAQRDDALFLHYSGHGTQTEDLDGDEQDGDDEAICPLDYETEGLIIDDESDHELCVQPLPAGCHLTAIFDSCHSATVMDLPYVYDTEGNIKEPDLLQEASEGLLGAGMDILRGDTNGIMKSLFGAAKSAFSANQANEKTKKTKTSPADVVMWSGCKDDQTSADTQEAGKATGAMSYAFIASLNKNPNQSYQELLISVREEMKGRYTQKPQLSACHPIDTDLQFVA
ncbi:hypothetical protein L202_08084 [Cryptococcus amylolentus CBS 6039]|uniref:Peptidase C14 caspase domain-containing protein n=1 Tax=Cryptococcus amylolentus CBS 6039 TaxID=1295533 RepID=A0A1E3HBA2_9TREE|nr:hypothetical protein L202_08084 [Cryptococcus amylolentus CBS 6039]ODN73584.1 hypothetical protein L202_08084 [Cryptococcus amylolentus CBS 6039]